ncbi:hypothetical protein BST85_07055 [Aureitalea marina]|uniref:Outer membrane protein beta-barrel domain-containing protein n=1 Tax=Aureitalea marina TaxID=930804 RepID=A0A2S7KQ19_9FLAO|nr:hypothetical protein BST85_07055 [Aureitalea marina]
MLLGTPAIAQVTNLDFNEETDKKDWSFSFTPYALLAAQSTDVGGEKIRQSFNDLSSITNAGFQFVSTVRYKRFSFSVDGTFATLGIEEESGPVSIEVGIKQNIIDLRGGYTFYSTFQSEETDIAKGWSIEGTLGGKNWVNNLVIDLNIDLGPIGSIQERIREPLSWWDMMVGVRTNILVSPKVLLGASFSVGGFGIGDSSKFTHDLTYINAFRVWRYMTINAGFRSFKYKRIDNGLETKVNVLGPLLGVSFILN